MLLKRTVFFLCLMSAAVLADPVARVQKIYGAKNLFIQKNNATPWYRSHIEQDAAIGDNFRTDPESMASIRFFLGGKANLGKACEIEIITEKDIDVVSQGVHLKKGTFWAKFNKQKEAPIRIKTAGGVMGIRGTEFVVQVAENGDTQLSLLEGDVVIDPEVGEQFEAVPGNEVVFGPEEQLRYERYTEAELESRLREQLGAEFMALRKELEQASRELREAQLEVREAMIEVKNALVGARLYDMAGEVDKRNAEAQAGLNHAEMDGLRRGLGALDEYLKTQDGKGEADPGVDAETSELLGELGVSLPGLEGQPPVAQEPNEEPAPPSTSSLGNHPTVSWDGMEGDKFAIFFLDETDDSVVHWADETEATSYTHPSDAEPFEPGRRYRFRVIPLDEQGEVAGAARDAFFVTQG